MGHIDISLAKTYELFRDIMTEIAEVFIDPVIHLGGDEVSINCLKNETEFTK